MFNTHVDEYMAEERLTDVAHMYELLRTQRPSGLVRLLHAFCQHMRATGASFCATHGCVQASDG